MFGEYASFIVPAYLITAIALIATAAVISFTYRNRRAELSRLESETE